MDSSQAHPRAAACSGNLVGLHEVPVFGTFCSHAGCQYLLQRFGVLLSDLLIVNLTQHTPDQHVWSDAVMTQPLFCAPKCLHFTAEVSCLLGNLQSSLRWISGLADN